jgi:hypothetical protein
MLRVRNAISIAPETAGAHAPRVVLRAQAKIPRIVNWLENRPAPNLPLAARPGVGHIGLNGAVAEWLKAAVC